MTNEELRKLFEDKSAEWRAGFFAAINLNSAMKAAFLKGMVGQQVIVTEQEPAPEK